VTDTETAVVAEPAADAPAQGGMSLKVDVSDIGPCRKRVHVTVQEADIAAARQDVVSEYCAKAAIPGFRPGRVPRGLVQSRFQRELSDELKQRVLVQSLEQLTQDSRLDPINEPDMDVEALEIPEAGDFEYVFEVEVRPEVDLPGLTTLTLKRPVRPVTDDDVAKYLTQMLLEYGHRSVVAEPAVAGDYIKAEFVFTHEGREVRSIAGHSVRLQPVLRFTDADLEGFDVLMAGASAGETRTGELTISKEATYLPMRGEKLSVAVKVVEVEKFTPAELNSELMSRIGFNSEEQLRERIREVLERQVTYRQRQTAREQLLEQITASAQWELPESLVLKQVENALHREILEMRQAGYSQGEIRARENELRQKSVSTTTQAMKEHFVLDKIATVEAIEVSDEELESEILMMAFQSGETPRRLRARLVKSGVIENLQAQIRERKAVDVALSRAKYEEVPMEEELVRDLTVEGVDETICSVMFARPTEAASL